jgi:sRNA-binding carbon storage regulator CsrA
MLIREIRPGQMIKIGDVEITMIQKSGQVARLGITADKSVIITEVKDPGKKPEPACR